MKHEGQVSTEKRMRVFNRFTVVMGPDYNLTFVSDNLTFASHTNISLC